MLWRCDPTQVMASSFLRFLDHTQRHATVGMIPLDEWSARRRDLYLTTHNTHNRQTSVPPVGFEPTISEGERPQTYALDRAATGTGICWCNNKYKNKHSDVFMAWYLNTQFLNYWEITNKMRPRIRIYYSNVSYCSTCFERHIAHHQELTNCICSL